MTITINLPPEEESRLRRRAARQGKDLNDFVRGVVQREATQEGYLEEPKEGHSLAEVLEGLIGTLNSGKPHLAENAEEEFGKGLMEEYQAQGLTFREGK
jgi:plasmid stability protein